MLRVSFESPEASDRRLREVIGAATLKIYDDPYVFVESPFTRGLPDVDENTLACIRDDDVWSRLVPAGSRTPGERFGLVRFHFPEEVDNSGFVGWLATRLKRKLGTGVFVTCGQNSRRGGIFDYLGFPENLRDAVLREISALRADDRTSGERSQAGSAGEFGASELNSRTARYREAFGYHFWAAGRIQDGLHRIAGGSAGAVRLLAHIAAAGRVWHRRLIGVDSSDQPLWPPLDLAAAGDLIKANQTDYATYLAQLRDEDLANSVEYTNTAGQPYRTRIDDILDHVLLHGSYHRGQIAMAIRAADAEPVSTDYITFIREIDTAPGAS